MCLSEQHISLFLFFKQYAIKGGGETNVISNALHTAILAVIEKQEIVQVSSAFLICSTSAAGTASNQYVHVINDVWQLLSINIYLSHLQLVIYERKCVMHLTTPKTMDLVNESIIFHPNMKPIFNYIDIATPEWSLRH